MVKIINNAVKYRIKDILRDNKLIKNINLIYTKIGLLNLYKEIRKKKL